MDCSGVSRIIPNASAMARQATSMTVHDLRHTCASLLVHAGANVKVVQRQLGHKSAAMTLDVYADLFDADLDAVGKMWARWSD